MRSNHRSLPPRPCSISPSIVHPTRSASMKISPTTVLKRTATRIRVKCRRRHRPLPMLKKPSRSTRITIRSRTDALVCPRQRRVRSRPRRRCSIIRLIPRRSPTMRSKIIRKRRSEQKVMMESSSCPTRRNPARSLRQQPKRNRYSNERNVQTMRKNLPQPISISSWNFVNRNRYATV